jgi:Methyltransferase domain
MKIFSLPLNPKLTQRQFDQYCAFVAQYRDWIYDIYFTSRVSPFDQDAMGDVFVNDEDKHFAIDVALHLQRTFGVSISATFNNIKVSPSQENLDIFIKNFKPLYDAGVRSATIPHTHWMATGQIKAAFPELMVKNTILRDVHTASEVVALAEAGFDYINLDRDLMRDRDTLVRLKQAKDWVAKNLNKQIKFSLLANEGCLGACPMMVEHFEYNCGRTADQAQYFMNPISRISCPKWDVKDPAVHLKTANLAPWREDWIEYIDLGIDVFKMHGRENTERLFDSMKIISKFAAGDSIIVDGFEDYLADNNLQEKPINVWREKIKNCKFDCWECQFCDKIYKSRSNVHYSPMVLSTVDGIISSALRGPAINIVGLTSPRVQNLINHLCKDRKTYLEVGSYLGSTMAPALIGNTLEHAYAVDMWKDTPQPMRDDLPPLPETNKQQFIDNIKAIKGNTQVHVFDGDMLTVNLNEIKPIEVMFYDGPHDPESTARAVRYFSTVLAQESILIFDDANFDGVVAGATAGVSAAGLDIRYQKIILNTIENKDQWWNGLFIVVAKKR